MISTTKGILLTSQFVDAFQYAFRLHAHQTRKGKNTPYIAHLLSVAALVLEMGGTEDETIAALLHDAVEDQGGAKTLDKIRTMFGENVAGIVAECTDSFTTPKAPWRIRKEKYLRHLKHASLSALRVSLADKLHNARTILLDLNEFGEDVWDRFNGGKEGTLWYYRTLANSFDNFPNQIYVLELKKVIHEIETASRNPNDA